MALKTINQNILDIDKGFVIHQVNCQGRMGSGVALAIKDKYPKVYSEYLAYYSDVYHKKDLLGQIQTVQIKGLFFIVNLFGQLNYGNDGKCYTDYAAVEDAFKRLKWVLECYRKQDKELLVHVPFLIGCNRAGGDWDTYSTIIEKHIPDTVVCKHET